MKPTHPLVAAVSSFRAVQIVGFAALCVAYFIWTWSAVLEDLGGDNTVYLFMAQYYSPWNAHSDLAATFARHSQYPPLYPFFLGLFNAGGNILVAHIVTTGFLLLALVAFYFWLRAVGLSTLLASVAVLLFALLPGTYFQALSILSENLYLLLSLVCLAAVARAETDGRGRWLWVAAVAVAGATLTRSAGASLLAAFIIYLALNRGVGGWRFVLVAALPVALWSLASDQLQHGYMSSLTNNYGSNLVDALARQLYVGVRMLWYGWHRNLSKSAMLAPVVAVIGIVCLAGMAQQVYRRKLDGLYVLFYLLMIVVWPFPGEAQRFMYAISPVLMAQGALFMNSTIKLKFQERMRDTALLLYLPAIFLLILPTFLLTFARFMQPAPEPYSEYKRTLAWFTEDLNEANAGVAFRGLIVDGLREAQEIVPEGECIYSIKPSVVSFYTQRASVAPPSETFSETEFRETLRKSKCRFFYLVAFTTPTFTSPFYPFERFRNRIRILRFIHPPGHPSSPVALLVEFAER